MLILYCRLDGLAPKTPKVRSMNSASKRKFETPLSRVNGAPASSPAEFKTPFRPGEKDGPA